MTKVEKRAARDKYRKDWEAKYAKELVCRIHFALSPPLLTFRKGIY